jgi:hypothetical protein
MNEVFWYPDVVFPYEIMIITTITEKLWKETEPMVVFLSSMIRFVQKSWNNGWYHMVFVNL